MTTREETTLAEAVHRIAMGTFYEDYDWAAGPGLRALNRALIALGDISTRAANGRSVQEIFILAERGLGR